MAVLAVWRRLDQRPALKVPDALPIRQRERAQLPRTTVAPLKWFQAFNELVAPVAAAALVRPAAKILLNHWPRFIDRQRPAIVFRSVQLGDCLVGILVIHGHETKTLGSACITIRNDADGFDCAVWSEQVVEISLCCLERQISDVNFLCHLLLPFKCWELRELCRRKT